MHSPAQRVPAASHTSRTHTTACPSCRKPMRGLELAGHYGKQVDVDLCVSCHMLWFDGHESVNLAGRGVLNLLRAIDESHGQSQALLLVLALASIAALVLGAAALIPAPAYTSSLWYVLVVGALLGSTGAASFGRAAGEP